MFLTQNHYIMQEKEKASQNLSRFEVPYDFKTYKKWCINMQAMSESTANSYISTIRTAFKELFAEDDSLFKNIRNGLEIPPAKISNPENWVSFMEDQFKRLIDYTKAVEEFGDIEIERKKNGEWTFVDSPKEMWVRAFQTYCRYIRWRIDNVKKILGFTTPAPKERYLYLELPAKRQFEFYLQNLGKGYSSTSIESYISRLKKLYNLLIRPELRRDFFEEATILLVTQPEILITVCNMDELIEREIEELKNPDISIEDLDKGMDAFKLYMDFLEDYMFHPKKYLKFPCNSIFYTNSYSQL